jgi:DNA-binding NarL/FixJ family response regulator
MDVFRILLADPQPIFRLGLRSVLSAHGGWEVCGEAIDGPDAVEKCIELMPDLVLLNIGMFGTNDVDVAQQILKARPDQKILILTEVASEKRVRDCLQAGVCGWILKSDGIRALTHAIEIVQEYDSIGGRRTAAVLVRGCWKGNPGQSAEGTPSLSPREQQVLQLVAEGRSSKDVAALLNIAEKTAETHRANLMAKLELHSLANLVVYAVRNELIHVQIPPAARLEEENVSVMLP